MLAKTPMSPPSVRFRSARASTTSPSMRVAFQASSPVSVVDATSFSIGLMKAPNASSAGAWGQYEDHSS